MSLLRRNFRHASSTVAILLGVLLSPVGDAQTFYNGTLNGSAIAPGSGLTGGTLALPTLSPLPAVINFGDTLGANSSSLARTVVDTYTFSFMSGQGATGGGSVTGDAIWFQGTNFSLSGIISGVTLTDTTAGTVLYSSSTLPVLATAYFLGNTTVNHSYSLQVTAVNPANSLAAIYTGVLLAQAIPEPESSLLLAAGLLALAGIGIARRRR